MGKTTPATAFLAKNGIAYELISYAYEPKADNIGLHAAQAINADPKQVFKTLMIKVDEKIAAVAVLPVDKQANMKKLAAIFSGKHAHMMSVEDAEKSTGYKVGGISPFGQRKRLPTVFDASILNFNEVYMNGGGRGLQIKLNPKDAIKVLDAKVEEFHN